MFTCWLEYPPKLAVANLVNSLKGVSVRLLRKERPDIQKRYCKGILWSASYFASSCGGPTIWWGRAQASAVIAPLSAHTATTTRRVIRHKAEDRRARRIDEA